MSAIRPAESVERQLVYRRELAGWLERRRIAVAGGDRRGARELGRIAEIVAKDVLREKAIAERRIR